MGRVIVEIHQKLSIQSHYSRGIWLVQAEGGKIGRVQLDNKLWFGVLTEILSDSLRVMSSSFEGRL